MLLRDQAVKDIALERPGATAIFRRNRIDFCCNGARSLNEAAAARGQFSYFATGDSAEPVKAVADQIRAALKHIPAERLVISTDCGMGREGMSRRHAAYKTVSLVLGTNMVRKEIGAPEAQVLAADARYSLVQTIKDGVA